MKDGLDYPLQCTCQSEICNVGAQVLTVECSVHWRQSQMCGVQWTLSTGSNVKCAVSTWRQYDMCSVHCDQCEMCSVHRRQSEMCSVHWNVQCPLSAMWNVQCPLKCCAVSTGGNLKCAVSTGSPSAPTLMCLQAKGAQVPDISSNALRLIPPALIWSILNQIEMHAYCRFWMWCKCISRNRRLNEREIRFQKS